jgi:putative ABC transport system permease protein
MSFRYTLKGLLSRKGRTVTNLFAVAVLVAMPVILSSLMNAYSAAMYLPFQNIGADMIVQKSAGSQVASIPENTIRLPFGKDMFSQDEVDNISGASHVNGVTKSLAIWYFDQGKFVSVEGIELAGFMGERLSSWMTSGRFLGANDRGKVVVEKHFSKFYTLKVGDHLSIGDKSFEIAGVISAQDKSQVSAPNMYMTLDDAQKLLGTKGVSQLYIKLDALSSEDSFRSEISQMDRDAIITSGSSIATSLSNAVKLFDRFHLIGSVLVALLAGLIIFQVSATGLMERRKEIGIMQAVGWTQRNIRTQIVSEIFLSAISGCIIGVAISALVIRTLGSISIQTEISQSLSNTLTTLSAPLTFSLVDIIESTALALGIALIVSFFLIRRMAGMKPLVNLRNS